MKKMSLMLLAAVVCWSGGAYADSINVTPGFLPSGSSPDGNFLGVRMRNFDSSANDTEIYLGKPSLGTQANRVQSHATYGESNNFLLEWNPNVGVLSFSLNNGAVDYQLAYTSTYAGDLNYIQFSPTEANTSDPITGQFRFFDLVLNGVEVTGIPEPFYNPNPPGNNYYLSGINLTDGFTLTGTLELEGVFGLSSEGAGKVDIAVGYRQSEGLPSTPFGPAPVVPVPAAAGLGFLGMGLVGFLRRRKIMAA